MAVNSASGWHCCQEHEPRWDHLTLCLEMIRICVLSVNKDTLVFDSHLVFCWCQFNEHCSSWILTLYLPSINDIRIPRIHLYAYTYKLTTHTHTFLAHSYIFPSTILWETSSTGFFTLPQCSVQNSDTLGCTLHRGLEEAWNFKLGTKFSFLKISAST